MPLTQSRKAELTEKIAAGERLDRRGERDTTSLHAEAEDIAHEPAGSMRDPYREGR